MGFTGIILIALALSMDAFAVSVTLGLSSKKRRTVLTYLTPGIYFGFFQALMPFIGYFAGMYFADRIQHLDHWVAFALLSLIGGKMIKESYSKDCEKADEGSPRFTRMLLLSIATSIDALAVGVTFAFFKVGIYKAVAVIGATTFIISIAGVKIGEACKTKCRSKAEFAGGVVLIALGIKILIEHLFF